MATLDSKRLAERVRRDFAENPAGLTPQSTSLKGLPEGCRAALPKTLGRGREGLVTDAKSAFLRQAGCQRELIAEIAGPDGARAFLQRAGRLAQDLPFRGAKTFDERRTALAELSEMGPLVAEVALPEIRKLLGQCEETLAIAKAAIRLTPAQLEHLMVGASAARALARMGPKASAELARARRVLAAMAHFSPPWREVIDLLKEELTDRGLSRDWRAKVAALLAGKGDAALPALIEVLLAHGGDDFARQRAAVELGRIGTEKTAQALRLAFLLDGRPGVRLAAKDALVKIGQRLGKPAVDVLEQGIASKDASVRMQALDGLGEIGNAARPALLRAGRSPSPDVRRRAVEKLLPIPPREVEDVREFMRLLEWMADGDTDPECKKAAKEAIRSLANRTP